MVCSCLLLNPTEDNKSSSNEAQPPKNFFDSPENVKTTFGLVIGAECLVLMIPVAHISAAYLTEV